MHTVVVRAAEFDSLFRTHVVEPLRTVGFERWDSSLWFEDSGLRAAVLRTELRSTWPFKLTLAVGHDCLRDSQDRLPAPRSRNPSDYPIKLEPSAARSLLGRWRYVPYNLGRFPADELTDGKVADQLLDVRSALADTFPGLLTTVTPDAVLRQLKQHGEGSWCERRWIADYERLR